VIRQQFFEGGSMGKNLIVILGPTASGKTTLAVKLAADLGGEIISADSRQVYRGMDIGTGKDLDQYVMEGKKIPCHLIDVVDPHEEFSLFEYQRLFYRVFAELTQKKVLPILVGGTGLYLEAVLVGYDLPPVDSDSVLHSRLASKTMDELREMLLSLKPRLHNTTDLTDKARLIRAIEIEEARKKRSGGNSKPHIDAVVFGIRIDRKQLRQRITERLAKRLNSGMIEEVKALHERGVSWQRLEGFGLEYRFVARYLQNRLSYDEMKMKLNTAIHQYAKRQETWFRRMERKGIPIQWIEGENYPLLKETAQKYVA